MLYTIVTLAIVIAVPVSFKLGQRRGVRLERESRWLGISSIDDLTPQEALGLASSATRHWTDDPWRMTVRDHITATEIEVKNRSLPELIATVARHHAAQQTLKQLESGS